MPHNCKEERVSGIDWMGTPLFEFHVRYEHEEDGRLTGDIEFPHGSGMVQEI